MKFGRLGPFRPEMVPQWFHIYRYGTETTDRGRERQSERILIAKVLCILATAKPEEQERYRQLSKTVTHNIIQRGAPIATENDGFVLMKNGKEGRSFRVTAVHNKGGLDIDTVYYCEERSDLGEAV